MNYQNILKIAEKKIGSEYEYIITDIKECIASGSTGGEISCMVGKYLKDLKIKKNQAYSILEKDIEIYLLECKKHGLHI